MIARKIAGEIKQALRKAPVVCLLGSRQTGKTTLAKAMEPETAGKSIYIDLELDSDFQALQHPELFLKQYADTLVIIDEIQRMPSLFPLLRALVDQNRRPGRFLILGSASPTLLRAASDSLAGRIRMIEISPFDVSETGSDTWRTLWLRGGYPESFLADDDAESYRWRLDYLAAFLERDIPNLGIRIPASHLRRALVMLSHTQAQLWNASQFGLSLGLSAPTVKHYADLLADTYIARILYPWYSNIGKRLVKTPKVLVRDSGLVHALMGIVTMDQLLSHPIVGHSWEAFCVETVLRNLSPGWNATFFRTGGGAEADLVLESAAGNFYCLEMKLSADPRPSKGFFQAMNDTRARSGFILTPTERRVPLPDDITHLSPWEFVEKILPELDMRHN